MNRFIYAAELKKQFKCYGHFYRLVLGDGSRADCRSVLEIVDFTIKTPDLSTLSEASPDAIIIMMNPGSSRPMDKRHTDEEISYSGKSASTLPKTLVLTLPDTTQYQVMRLMRCKKWAHVRVLNLSDLREPKSNALFEKSRMIEKLSGGGCHTIFCEERSVELERSIKRKTKTPILLAWGRDSFLKPLARLCLERIGSQAVTGLPAAEDGHLFFHPSPMLHKNKVRWLQHILKKLE